MAATLVSGEPVQIAIAITNRDRSVGALTGYEITKRFGGNSLPDDTVQITLTGSAGQSFGAFVPKGITMRLIGDANDYVGKGLSGGRIVVAPDPRAPFVAEDQIIAGNVLLYGATSGELYVRGRVGERFCVRNSGATAVVEGVGDHGCEYMTGGRAVVLGPTGRNFGAGMSGGMAFLFDPARTVGDRVNNEMVDVEPLTDEDAQWLREVLAVHLAETGSAVAERILDDPASLADFVKIMPRDYRRVLKTIADAERDGRDVNEAIMEASHG
jgi:glutamate synthase (NADPH/NADH) large chain